MNALDCDLIEHGLAWQRWKGHLTWHIVPDSAGERVPFCGARIDSWLGWELRQAFPETDKPRRCKRCTRRWAALAEGEAQ